MEIAPLIPSNKAENTGVLSVVPARKAPWPLKVAGICMGLFAVRDIVVGVLFILVFATGFKLAASISIFIILLIIFLFVLGIALIIIGILMIKYAKAVFTMQKKAYVGSFVLLLLEVSISGLSLIRSGKSVSIATGLLFLGMYLYIAVVLYYYREKFVH